MTLQNFSSHVSGVLLCFFPSCFGLRKAPFFLRKVLHTNTLQNTSEDHTKCAPKSPIRSSRPPKSTPLISGVLWHPPVKPNAISYIFGHLQTPQVRIYPTTTTTTHHPATNRTVFPPPTAPVALPCKLPAFTGVSGPGPASEGWVSSQRKRRAGEARADQLLIIWGMGKSHLKNDGESLVMGILNPLRNWG